MKRYWRSHCCSLWDDTFADHLFVRYEMAVMKDPALRVMIGTDAYKAIMSKVKAYGENYKKHEKLSNSTDVGIISQQPIESFGPKCQDSQETSQTVGF